MRSNEDVVEYYTGYDEADRLHYGASRLELARSQELILRHLPDRTPLRIVDIGGAAGIYSFWLAEQGHEVHLYDLTPKHIELARERNASAAKPLASARVGDARQLPFASEWADAVLLFGPLYHLPERANRLQAIAEARRVLKSGGLLFAAAISRFASLMDGFGRGFARDPSFVTIIEQDLATGVHHNPSGDPRYFTTAYFHRPEDLAAELTEAGLDSVRVYSVESFGSSLSDFDAIWDNPADRALLLDMIRRVETEPALLGVGWHRLAIGAKE